MSKLWQNKLSRRIVILTAVLLTLFGYTVFKDHQMLLESGAGAALNPVQKVVYSANKRLESFIDFFLRYEEVKLENESLLKENIELKANLRNFDSLEAENQRLKEMFAFKNRMDQYDYIGVNVIGKAGGGIITSYIIDKGTEEGLLPGMVIMTEEGIVGQITETAGTWSLVETLSSENISIHVTTLEDNSSSGILDGYVGAGQRQMAKISFLPVDASIKEGDPVVTSGLGRFYPPGFLVGTVTRVEEDRGNLMKTAHVKTAVNFKEARMLYVVLPKSLEDVSY